MKQRAGLGKKVSSIFDGVPLPNSVQDTQQPQQRAEPQLPAVHKQINAEIPPRQVPSVSQVPQSAPAAQQQQQRPAPVHKPQAPAIDKPILKVNTIAVQKESVIAKAFQQLVHKFLNTGDKEIDERNIRAVAMAGVLFVILVVVLWWTGIFSGSGSNRNVTNSASAATNDIYINWTIPQPLPSDLPDLMTLGSKTTRGGSVSGISGAPVVKSIVFSDKPTAVISGEIVREGQKLEGTNITITKIYKDKIEFSQNGKSWTQQVE